MHVVELSASLKCFVFLLLFFLDVSGDHEECSSEY